VKQALSPFWFTLIPLVVMTQAVPDLELHLAPGTGPATGEGELALTSSEAFNQEVYMQVRSLEQVEEDTGRAAWRNYMQQITADHAGQVRVTLAMHDLKELVAKIYASVASDGGLEFSSGTNPKFEMFMTQVLDLFNLPRPKGGEMVWAHLFRRFAKPNLGGEEGAQKRRLTKEHCQLMVSTLAHVILKAYSLSVLRVAMTRWVKEILASPAWKGELENLKRQGISGVQDIQSKKEQIFKDEVWQHIFGKADVGCSGQLSWATKQFHVFVGGVLNFLKFPEPADEEVKRKMFVAFASEGSDLITNIECRDMVEAALDAITMAMQI